MQERRSISGRHTAGPERSNWINEGVHARAMDAIIAAGRRKLSLVGLYQRVMRHFVEEGYDCNQ